MASDETDGPGAAARATRAPPSAHEPTVREAVTRGFDARTTIAAPPTLAPAEDPVAGLLAILDLEPLEMDLFRGRSPRNGWARVFGGQVVAQALVAASRTVEPGPGNLHPHSLHAYFILGGDPAVPIVYEVERIRDGRSFATRRVKAIQHGEAIFALSASYQVEEEGHAHAAPMPKVPFPEDLPDEREMRERILPRMPDLVRRFLTRERPIELRPVELERYASRERHERLHVWLRVAGRLPDDPAIHRAALAYASDMTLLDASLAPHGRTVFEPGIQAASLDHALWLHAPFRADEWLLYAQDTPFAGGARGFARGQVFTRDGRLIASVAQEGLVRPRPDREAGA